MWFVSCVPWWTGSGVNGGCEWWRERKSWQKIATPESLMQPLRRPAAQTQGACCPPVWDLDSSFLQISLWLSCILSLLFLLLPFYPSYILWILKPSSFILLLLHSVTVYFCILLFSPASLSFSSPSLNLSCFVLCLRSLPLLCGCSILSQRVRPPPSHIGVEHKQAAAWIKHLTQNPLRRSGVLGWAMVLRHGALVTHGHTFFSVCLCVTERERERACEQWGLSHLFFFMFYCRESAWSCTTLTREVPLCSVSFHVSPPLWSAFDFSVCVVFN